MQKFMEPIFSKINHVMATFIINGILLVILSVLITWSALALQLLVSLVILIIAFSFFFFAYKLHSIKKIIKKF